MKSFNISKSVGLLPFCVFVMFWGVRGNPEPSTSIPRKRLSWELMATRDTFDLYMRGQRVGRQLYRCRVDSGIGRIITDLEFTVTGGSSEMIVHERREFDLRGDLTRAEQKLSGSGGTTLWKLDCSEPDSCLLTVSTAGIPHSRKLGMVKDHLRTELHIRTSILNKSAEIGMVWRDTTFDLVSATPVVVQTECIAVPGPEHPGRYVFLNRDSAIRRDERWEVDTLGRTLVQEIASLYTARRTDVERGNDGSTDTSSLEALTEMYSIPVESAPRKDQTVLLRTSDGEQLSESVRSFYRTEGDDYILMSPANQCSDSVFSQFVDSLRIVSTPVMQSANDRIRNLAKELIGSVTDRCEKIRTINRFVYEKIEKRNVATFSSALATLEAGFGDCGEHAALLGALLRAAGIEAEIVYGLVYIAAKRGYFYHAWVQIPGNEPLFCDPALGRFPAVEGYIPLVVDNTGEKLAELGALIDRVSIEHVEEHR